VAEDAGARDMHLIVGLGNPGLKYERTPHNLGFLTIDRLASDEGIRVVRPEANCLVGKGEIRGEPALLAKPLSFMNLSGGPVKSLLGKYELEPKELLVIYDDLALPWEHTRLRENGSAGGHRGLESIITSLGTSDFPRLRLGIDPGRPTGDSAEFVLRPFRPAEREQLDEVLGQAADAVRLFISDGAAKAMTVYNRRAAGSTEET
jgi:PTH1 family peptidyl-tRNA hydrolase